MKIEKQLRKKPVHLKPTQGLLLLTHISWTKWPPYRRRHVQTHFLEWKCLNLKYNFSEISSFGSNWQYVSIGSDNGLVPYRRQAIIWTNADPFHLCIYAALRGDELASKVSQAGVTTTWLWLVQWILLKWTPLTCLKQLPCKRGVENKVP